MDAGASAGCSGDCDEEQEDPSSSSLADEVIDINDGIEELDIQDNSQNNSGEDELSAFRQRWQRELESTPAPQNETPAKKEDYQTLTDEERAKKFFLRGAELERGGKWYEAVQYYKRAMQIVPDIELRLYEAEGRADTPQEETETVEEAITANTNEEDDDDFIEGEDLLTRLSRIQARKGVLCEPEFATRAAHISWLPYEVILLVLRWVVGAELDATSLERLGMVCRGLHLASRERDIWRAICVKTWGMECGTPRVHGFASWRQMYIERPRLQLHGCYISKTTYLRHGENSFQDQFYRPWYLIDYYRYLRFFPDGLVLMWTTAEEPAACVSQLKQRLPKPGLGIMPGHYRLMADKVVIVIKKCSEKKSAQGSNSRFRPRRREAEHEQTFHMELQLRSVRARRNAQLAWTGYSVCTRRDQWTQFELTGNKFPPFAFSRVRNYTRESHAPLTTALGS